MSVYEKGLVTILGFSLILVLIAIPLILRKVPRNIVYGYRTRATLRDDYVRHQLLSRDLREGFQDVVRSYVRNAVQGLCLPGT